MARLRRCRLQRRSSIENGPGEPHGVSPRGDAPCRFRVDSRATLTRRPTPIGSPVDEVVIVAAGGRCSYTGHFRLIFGRWCGWPRRMIFRTSKPMPRQYVNTLIDGSAVDEIFLLADKQLRANRNADLYLLAQLRDKTGQVSGLLWNVTEDSIGHIRQGDYVKVRGKVQLYQGHLQLILKDIDHVPDAVIDHAEFQMESAASTEKLFSRLQELLSGISPAPLREVLFDFLNDPELQPLILQAPAGIRLHHAYHGGLIEHIVNLMEAASRLADLYPKIDFNLVLAGVFLHDIGKVRELSFDTTFVYTDEGQLLGHLLIGVEMLGQKIAQWEQRTGQVFPAEISLRLKHMIASHHGSHEFGSPKLPMTPEAVVLHYLDTLDAKLHEFLALIDGDPNSQSNWTPFQASIQRKVYKGAEKRGMDGRT
jgi:3'-5' exoribonuclease